MLLGLINLGSTSAFTAFVSVGVQALAASYGIPIAISLICGRSEVVHARWNLGQIAGTVVNTIALLWIAFELVLFSMPTALPVTATSMNYASVVLVGFGAIAVRRRWLVRLLKHRLIFILLQGLWYIIHSRKSYKGPPASEGL